jgi:primosomal replication protein N
MVLKHESEVSEDGQPRKVSMDLKAVAIGERITRQIAARALGVAGVFSGFLAGSRNGRGTVFHVTAFD